MCDRDDEMLVNLLHEAPEAKTLNIYPDAEKAGEVRECDIELTVV